MIYLRWMIGPEAYSPDHQADLFKIVDGRKFRLTICPPVDPEIVKLKEGIPPEHTGTRIMKPVNLLNTPSNEWESSSFIFSRMAGRLSTGDFNHIDHI